jgi:ankyrin repeat protein
MYEKQVFGNNELIADAKIVRAILDKSIKEFEDWSVGTPDYISPEILVCTCYKDHYTKFKPAIDCISDGRIEELSANQLLNLLTYTTPAGLPDNMQEIHNTNKPDLISNFVSKFRENIIEQRENAEMFEAECRSGNEPKIRNWINNISGLVNHTDDEGKTPLYKACEVGLSVQLVEFLLSKGANVNHTDDEGKTPLYKACEVGLSAQLVEFLLSKGANVNHTDDEGKTPLYKACEVGLSAQLVKFLLSKGANINSGPYDNNWTPLMEASSKGNKEIVSVLLENIKDVASLKKVFDETKALQFCREQRNKGIRTDIPINHSAFYKKNAAQMAKTPEIENMINKRVVELRLKHKSPQVDILQQGPKRPKADDFKPKPIERGDSSIVKQGSRTL